MSTVAEIEAAIAKLPRKELWELKQRLDRRFEADWDKQIEEDAKAGKLDKLFEQADSDFEAGRCKPL